MNPPLDKATLLEGLTTRVFGRKLFVFAEIDSTNACARALAETGNPIGTVVVADHQTAGRGRLGRRWEAEPRTNLLMSVLLGSGREFAIWRWSYLLSEATARAVHRTTGLSVATKWPNDLLIESKKCCGILLETAGTVDQPSCLGGIGLNVNQTRFPDDLEAKATSLRLATGSEQNRTRIFHDVMENLEELYDRSVEDGGRAMLASWTERCVTFGRPVVVSGAGMNLEGTAVGLSDDGGLVVRHGTRSTTVYAGDVTISDSRA